MTLTDAGRAQITAADPGTSTWLSANAGSGKTRVLTDRVARLLLDGTPPQRILCLTYTKAAASEMQNRLFTRLGDWAMRDDDALEQALRDLGVPDGQNTQATRRAARTLFARAIETPGGLKIQTIHSFCSAVLRRFPLEAGVSSAFVEMDETAARKLQAEVLDQIAEEAAGEAALDGLAELVSDATLDGVLDSLLKARDALDLKTDRPAILDGFGLDPDTTAATVATGLVTSQTLRVLQDAAPILAQGSKTDMKLADGLTKARACSSTQAAQIALEAVLLTQAGIPRKNIATKATAAALGPILTALQDLTDRVLAARDARLSCIAADRAAKVMAFARVFLPAYERAKLDRGVLDFDDLIAKTRALLTRPGVAQWVLFRLDGGLDHILVDEAQDTSPHQWDVVRLLAQEFTAGQGARADIARTIFVVGDQKQSIYSFQGADPAGFDRMRGHFRDALDQVGQPFQDAELRYSFRSAPAILRVVDETFAGPQSRGLLDPPRHAAFFDRMPGRVDLWPEEPPTDEADPPDWRLPVDLPAATDPKLALARRIAAYMKDHVDAGTRLTDAKGQTRAVRPGDFMILVQRRSEIFHEVIRACKDQGLPVAGADRLRVGAELAVRDLIALLSFVALPEDDLALATALRSPLLGWSEAELYTLAHGRDGFLWARLRAQDATSPPTTGILRDLLDQVDYLRPYELLERVLIRHGGRQALLARLGPEAEDGIDALLDQALAYETQETPNLTGFLTWFKEDALEIKRQLDDAGDQVRVMTVHGAKGLESPIVILPDTAVRKPPSLGQVTLADNGVMAWLGPAADMPDSLREIQQARVDRLEQERARLLYVAMTRAESWLIVAAAGKTGTRPDDSWYQAVKAGLTAAGAASVPMPGGTGLRFTMGDWPDPAPQDQTANADLRVDLPDWCCRAVTAAPDAPRVIQPSDLGGAKSLGGGRDDATLTGQRLHLLLEHLPGWPRSEWPRRARHLLTGPLAPEEDGIGALLDKLSALVDSPDLGDILSTPALTEVALTADTPLGRLSGAIDRLILRPAPAPVLAVDFKSNVRVPDRPEDVPDGILRQMGAYAHALRAIYPDRRIETALVWTETARVMPLPAALVDAAFARATPLDGSGRAS